MNSKTVPKPAVSKTVYHVKTNLSNSIPAVPGSHFLKQIRQRDKAKGLSPQEIVPLLVTWQRPAFPGFCNPSIIGPGGLNFRVRDGNGWNPSGIVTRSYSWFEARCATFESEYSFKLKKTVLANCSLKTAQILSIVIRIYSLQSLSPEFPNLSCSLLARSSPRPISTGQLHTSRRFHTRPIYLIIFQGSYQLMLWEISS